MISYRPIPDLTVENRGFKAAIAAMALAAVLGITAFAPADTAPAVAAETHIIDVVGAAGVLPAEQISIRRQDTGGSLDQGAAAGPLTA